MVPWLKENMVTKGESFLEKIKIKCIFLCLYDSKKQNTDDVFRLCS